MIDRFKLTTTAVLIFFCAHAFAQQWLTYKVDDLVTISFPTKPGIIDTLQKQLRIYAAKDSASSYTLMATTQKQDISNWSADDVDHLYQTTLAGIKASPGTTEIKSVKDIKINGLNGKEIVYVGSKVKNIPTIGIVKLLFVNGTLYIVSYMHTENLVIAPELKSAFFNSFALNSGTRLKQVGKD